MLGFNFLLKTALLDFPHICKGTQHKATEQNNIFQKFQTTHTILMRKLRSKFSCNIRLSLPGRRVLYPGTHREAVGSRDWCSQPESFSPLHERPSGGELRSCMQSVYTLNSCNAALYSL